MVQRIQLALRSFACLALIPSLLYAQPIDTSNTQITRDESGLSPKSAAVDRTDRGRVDHIQQWIQEGKVILLAKKESPKAAQSKVPADVERIEALIRKYGKGQIVAYIRKARGGQITVIVDKEMSDFLGPPNEDLITAGTISEDLKKLKISTTDLEAQLTEPAAPKTAEKPEDFSNQAKALLSESKHEEALKAAQSGLSKAEAAYGKSHAELVQPLTLLADIQEGRKNYPEAIKYLEQCRSIQEASKGKNSPDVAETISRLITLYEQTGDKKNADNLNKVADARWGDPNVRKQEIALAQWSLVTDSDNYTKLNAILTDYNAKHTYSKSDFFVCADMATDVWNMVKTVGINAKLVAGSANTDLSQYPPIKYLARMDHVWVMAEVKPSLWVPLETTGGFIVTPKAANYPLYRKGMRFENAGEFKDFIEERNAFFRTCSEAIKMIDTYEKVFEGGPATRKSAEFAGRTKQKADDCDRLMEKMNKYITPSMRRDEW